MSTPCWRDPDNADHNLEELHLRCIQLGNQVDDLTREAEQLRNRHSAAMAQARETDASLAEGWLPRALSRAEQECDALRQWKNDATQCLAWYLEQDTTQEGGTWEVYCATELRWKRKAQALLAQGAKP